MNLVKDNPKMHFGEHSVTFEFEVNANMGCGDVCNVCLRLPASVKPDRKWFNRLKLAWLVRADEAD